MATFGKKYVNNNNYSDEDEDDHDKDYRPQVQKNSHQKEESDDEQNQWEQKRQAYSNPMGQSIDKKPQGSGPRYEQGQKNVQQAAYKKEESDDDYEQNQWEQKTPIYTNPMGQSIDKKSQASVRASHQSHQSENENFNKIRDAFNDNKKQSISMEPEKPVRRTGKWDAKRDFEEEESRTPTEKLSRGDEDFNTASFGEDKLPRIRKQWGAQEKSETLTTSVKDLDHQPKRKTEEDEAEMLESYRQNKAQKEKKEEVKEEVAPPAKQEKQAVIVFAEEEDEVAKLRKQEQFEKMRKRMEQRQKDKEEKKERDRSFVRENAKERATPDIVANYSDNEDAVPSSKKPQNKFTRQSTTEKPPEKLPRIPSAKPNIPRNQSANVATRPPIDKERERPEHLEELHSVGPSAKSNKSIAKSPGGPNNNIFQKERTPSAIGGKKGVIEFSKQSNRPLIKNAITNVCLAGEPNRKEREEVVAKLNEVTGDVNFIIVFKPITGRQDFRALYAYDINTEEIRKVFSKGNAPEILDANLVENYYRYNSGAKEFKHIQGNKNFSRAVDAVSLHAYLFKKATDRLEKIL